MLTARLFTPPERNTPSGSNTGTSQLGPNQAPVHTHRAALALTSHRPSCLHVIAPHPPTPESPAEPAAPANPSPAAALSWPATAPVAADWPPLDVPLAVSRPATA